MKEPESSPKVLLVDDDDAFRQVMSGELTRRQLQVRSVASGEEALRDEATADADVILLDLKLPGIDGIEVLKQLRERDVRAAVVVLTGHGTIDTAIQATRLGAYDYLEKPCPIDKVEMTIRKTCEHYGLLARQKVLQDGYSAPDFRQRMVGGSPAFLKMCQTVERIAETEASTLLTGETGVGKDIVATLLHTLSRRRDAPYVVVNCAALHEDLLQSELFGHEKGAFSGAERRKHGLFEVAHGGTLFLDEVGDTNREIQAMLLRVLETGEFRRLGGNEEITVDVRVVSATNRDLERSIERGRFREDLFYRLATMKVEIPPLRERREDIPLLLDHYLGRLNRRFSHAHRLDEPAREALIRYDWPGNVRELIHALEQAVVLCDDEIIRLDDLPVAIRGGPPPAAAKQPPELLPLRAVEQRHVEAVLEAVGGNRARAAEVLQISERNLYRLIKKHAQSAPGAD